MLLYHARKRDKSMSRVIPVEVKQRCVELYNKGTSTEKLYKEHYLKYGSGKLSTFERQLRKWRSKTRVDNELLEKGNLSYKFTPHATTVQVDKNGEIIQSWIKGKAQDDLYLDLIENINNLPPHKPIEKRAKQIANKMLEITFDDMHWGIAVFEDYIETLQDTIEIIEREQWEEINIVIGADLMHTDDLRGHTSNQTYIGAVDVKQAYNDCLRFYFEIMEYSLKCSDKVNVIYNMGNHSETLSWTIVQVLKVKYPDANYDDSFEHRKLIRYHDIFIGITHGDTIKNNLRDVKELFIEEFTMDYAKAKIKEIHISHLHQNKESGDINGCMVRRLSTKAPTDDWHRKHGYTASIKRFMLFEYSRDRLLSVHYV